MSRQVATSRFLIRPPSKALSLAGGTDGVALGTGGPIAGTPAAFTIFAWVRRINKVVSLAGIVGDLCPPGALRHFILQWNSAMRIVTSTTAASGFVTAVSARTIMLGEACRVCYRYDGSKVDVFTQGVKDATSAALTGAIQATLAGVSIGTVITGPVRPLAGQEAEVSYFERACTDEEIAKDFFFNAILTGENSRRLIAGEWKCADQAATLTDSVGTNHGVITGAVYVDSPFAVQRVPAVQRVAAFVQGTALAKAFATITIDDWTGLGGSDAHLSFTFEDWTAMAGSSFSAMGGELVITTGVDFQAETSNEVTAQNFADFCNAALGDPGEEVVTVVGNVATFNVPDNGFQIDFIGSGVTPESATSSGGVALTKIGITDSMGPNVDILMTSDPSIVDPGSCQTGTSNEECATNIAAHTSFVPFTPVAIGNTVTFYWPTSGTVGNDPANTVVITGREDGEPSHGISPETQTFYGGTDSVGGRSRQAIT